MKKIISALLAFTLLFFGACSNPSRPKPDSTYLNPIFSPVFADPCIIRGDDGYFYAYATEDYGSYGGQDKVACVPIIKSKDLVNWEYVGDVFASYEKPIWGTLAAGVWAPDIIKIGNTYNLYYSLSIWTDTNPGIGVATASSPAGPWTDHGMVLNSENSGVKNSIDSCTFVYEDRVYLVWGSFYGIYMVELESDGLSVKDMGSKTLVAGAANSSAYEGSYIIERNGSYYLFLALGHCCQGIESTYYTNVAKADSPFGVWKDRSGKTLLGKQTNGELVVKGSEDVTGTGHNAVVKDDNGDYWIVYHGYETKYTAGQYGSSPRRSLFIDKLLWDEDGFPYVENKVASYRQTEAPVIK